MSDLISRQDAIDAIRASTSKYTGFMEMEMYTDDDAVEAINGVPSAERTGHWIWESKTEISSDGWKCSACNMEYHTQVPYFGEFNYCPNCGARMVSE